MNLYDLRYVVGGYMKALSKNPETRSSLRSQKHPVVKSLRKIRSFSEQC